MFNICIQFVNGESIHIRSEEMPETNDDKTMLRIKDVDNKTLFMAFTAHILYFTTVKCDDESDAERFFNYYDKLSKDLKKGK